jgi:hypothetical protein
MWNFLDAVQRADVIECVDTRRQTSVETEDLVIDESGQGEIIEEVGEKPDMIGQRHHGGGEGQSYFQTFALPYLRRHSS